MTGPLAGKQSIEVVPKSFLAPEFESFRERNGISANSFACQPSRYIRVNPRNNVLDSATVGNENNHVVDGERIDENSGAINSDGSASKGSIFRLDPALEKGSEPVDWLPGTWYKLPSAAKIVSAEQYQRGQIYGIDAASGAAALALDMGGSDVKRVLDLCCAPGAKLCLLADMNRQCQVVGVDVAEARLSVCRTILRKYGVDNACVIRADGRTFGLEDWDPVDAIFAAEKSGHGKKGRKRKREQVFRNNGFGETVPAEKNSNVFDLDELRSAPKILFDRVLVDAECTHDGSVKHIEKFQSTWGMDTLARRVPWLSEAQLDDLVKLQKSLLLNGWRNLKKGGVLVYSTCSFAECQNEEVISWFLTQSIYRDEAELDPLPFELEKVKAQCPRFGDSLKSTKYSCKSHAQIITTCAARFNPGDSDTSGLFLARLRKKAQISE